MNHACPDLGTRQRRAARVREEIEDFIPRAEIVHAELPVCGLLGEETCVFKTGRPDIEF